VAPGERHELVFNDFETGRISLDRYLACTVFYRERPFTPESFKAYMFDSSTALNEGLEILGHLSQSCRYLMATLNNESAELNKHRIEKFRLHDHFSFFISSCYVGHRKPETAIYRLALDLSQCEPPECVFIDDRALNVERAAELGIHAIQYLSAEQLTADLGALGVSGD
jgi:putative hydrolase of the HAD superfamily